MNSQVRYRILIALRGFVKFVFPAMLIYIMTSSTSAVVIEGGKMQDVVVLDSGSGPGRIGSYRDDAGTNWQPDAFDLDLEGNIYLQDPFNGRIQIFDKSGEFSRQIRLNKLLKDRVSSGLGLVRFDIAASVDGSVYIMDRAKNTDRKEGFRATYFRVVKISRSGIVLCKIAIPDIEFCDKWISSDCFGNLYIHQGWVSSIYVYNDDCSQKTQFAVTDLLGPEPGVLAVQKEDTLGKIMFIRNGHLCITTAEDISKGLVIDSIRIPDELLQMRARLIGFDLSGYIYFLQHRDTLEDGKHASYDKIFRYENQRGELVESAVAILYFDDFPKNQEIEQAFMFLKRYVVKGSGEIYFLHGTIKKLHISKLTFN